MNDPRTTHAKLTELAETSGWARQLARRLVGDEHLAEDVVQDAYLAALQAPDAVRSRSAWLAGAVRNLARGLVRDRARRVQREERGARGEALPATADTAARLEQQEILIRTLLQLEEPFRGALLARYVDGLPPRKIASQLGVPIATVNSRLARGLSRLRTRLEADHGGDRAQWIAAFAPLLRPPVVGKGSPILGVLLMKKTIAAAALVLLIPLAYFLVAESSPLPATGEKAPVEVPAPVVQGAEDPLEPEELPDARERIARPEREAVEAHEVTEPEGAPSRVLRVIDHHRREPVAGAEVFVATQEAMMIAALKRGVAAPTRMPEEHRQLLIEAGKRYVTDEEGSVEVRGSAAQAVVLARHGDTFGVDALKNDGEVQVIVLEPDKLLRVRVLDSTGRAVAGVPVALLGTTRGVSGHPGRDLPLSQATTAAEEGGEPHAVLAWFQHSLAQHYEQLSVALDFPLTESVRLPVHPSRWPSGTVDLELPPVGSVRFTIRDHDADSPVGRRTALLRTRPEEGFPAWAPEPGSLTVTARDGSYRFWPVGLDTELVVSVYSTDPGVPVTKELLGPTREGEEREVELDIGGRLVTFVGRLLEPDGEPCASSSLVAELGDPENFVHFDLEEDGSFEFEFTEYKTNPLVGVARLTDASPTGGRRTGQAPIRITPTENRCDLGDVRFEESVFGATDPSDLAGRVVDTSGEPVGGAYVSWSRPLRGEAGRVAWPGSVTVGAVALPDGRFRITSKRPDPDARLEASTRNGLFHEPRPLEQLDVNAEGELLLVMEPGAALTGRLKFDAGIDPSRLQVHAWDQAGGAVPSRRAWYGWREVKVQPDGRFRLKGLRPGRFTIRAGIGEVHTRARLVEDVDVVVGENSDPRLEPIDLRGMYRLFDLLVVDEAGQPVRASVRAFRNGVQNGRPFVFGPESLGVTGSGPIVLGEEPEAALLLQASEFFPVLLDPLNLPETVVLSRGFELELEWSGARSLADLPARLRLDLVPLEEPWGLAKAVSYLRTFSPGQADLASDGPTTTRVPAPGTYRLRWTIIYEWKSGHYLRRKIELEEPQTLQVEDAPGTRLISLDESILEREVAWLRGEFDRLQERGTIPAELRFGERVDDSR